MVLSLRGDAAALKNLDRESKKDHREKINSFSTGRRRTGINATAVVVRKRRCRSPRYFRRETVSSDKWNWATVGKKQNGMRICENNLILIDSQVFCAII